MMMRNEEERMSKGEHSEAKMIGAVKQMEAGRKAEEWPGSGRERSTHVRLEGEVRRMAGERGEAAAAARGENRRLKHLVADLSLDKDTLKAVISKNGWSS